MQMDVEFCIKMNRILRLCICVVIGLRFVNSADNAFVTLVYGEDFLLGVRVLGQSIRESKTKADLVVIVTGGLSEDSVSTLKGDGWIVLQVDEISNPGKGPQSGQGFPSRFSSVYTKLTIFKLVQYQKIVFLDADTMMLRNSDELFSCPGFCATLRHSERFNSGVMVVTPSEELYKDMISKIHALPSYTGGDQGFLNAYYEGFINAPLYDPSSPPAKGTKMMRLATGYNADIGLYLLNSNKWMIPDSQIKIVHYTLGPFKPWNWWTTWILQDLDAWQQFRYNLPPDVHDNDHGVTSLQLFYLDVMIWIPPLIIGLGVFKFNRRGKSTASLRDSKKSESIPSTSAATFNHPITARLFLPNRFVGYSIIVGFSTLLLSINVVLMTIPREIPVFWGWVLVYEWILFFHGVLFGLYLIHCFRLGKKTGSSMLPSFRFVSWSKPWSVTIKSTLIASLLIVFCPWSANLISITSFVGRVLVTAIGALILASYLTHVYGNLPIRWFMFGRAEFAAKNGG